MAPHSGEDRGVAKTMPWVWVLLPGHRGAGIHHDQRIGFFSCRLDVFIPLSSLAPPGAWEDPGGGSLDFFLGIS